MYPRSPATVTAGPWTLAFRVQSATSVKVYDDWNHDGRHDDQPLAGNFPLDCVRMFDYASCDRDFRSHILDDWNGITEVYISVIKDDLEVAYVIFNAAGTDRISWFQKNKITNSTWFPAIRDDNLTWRSKLSGYCIPNLCRRFYLYGPETGCNDEWFYFMVFDIKTDWCDWAWGYVVPNGHPIITYSPSSGRASFGSNLGALPRGEFADVMAVYVKFT
ncbi:hypothetical protein ElyMa_002678500 [Elysia marginata]|uniref:Uncharacterized protein n=1 Tax=Elysia marginata TaxID=1093978 RepID=A0AAV4HAB7_9GAST|nr:hypothetical protein ElyMa_002678500 [Elysia marginata]